MLIREDLYRIIIFYIHPLYKKYIKTFAFKKKAV